MLLFLHSTIGAHLSLHHFITGEDHCMQFTLIPIHTFPLQQVQSLILQEKSWIFSLIIPASLHSADQILEIFVSAKLNHANKSKADNNTIFLLTV
jgi:hypothetical protein